MKKPEKQIKEESCLFKIPVLGYILRKIRKNREAIEKTLKTENETDGKIKKKSFLGIFGVVSGKRFDVLKLKKRKNGQSKGKNKKKQT